MNRQICLDTETTGLSTDNGDRIIEIGCVELVARKLTGNDKHFYLNPGRDSHPDALRVHGITTEFLRDKPPFHAVVNDLFAYLQGADIVIHNAAFDVGFLNKELELAGHTPFPSWVQSITDTLAMAKELYPGKRNSLDALCDRLEIDRSGRTLHGALLDAQLLADVYIRLTRGQDALLIADDAQSRAALGQNAANLRALGLQLHVLPASPEELTAHEGVLAQIDKASAGKTIWRNI